MRVYMCEFNTDKTDGEFGKVHQYCTGRYVLFVLDITDIDSFASGVRRKQPPLTSRSPFVLVVLEYV